MLADSAKLNFKRAVFITENAYLGGSLSYSAYDNEIKLIAQKLRGFVKERGLQQYKTALHFAIFHFMTQPDILNGSKPYSYDFNDNFGENDFKQTFVTKLMKTHQGNCHSLPMFYKILAEELKIEAFLALAPQHMYIKHIDEEGKWVNLELTNGHPSSDAWIISSCGISREAIKSGIYMEPLTLKESVAFCLLDLAYAHHSKYGNDQFFLKCTSTALKFFPTSINALMMQHDYYYNLWEQEYKANGLTALAKDLEQKIMALEKRAEQLGYQEAPNELVQQWEIEMEKEKQKQIKQ